MTTSIPRAQDLDAFNRPLREAVNNWSRLHGFGYSQRWSGEQNRWIIRLFAKIEITVEIWENGSRAEVAALGNIHVAARPAGLRRALDRILDGVQ